jgi:Type IV pilin-like G and H, putative
MRLGIIAIAALVSVNAAIPASAAELAQKNKAIVAEAKQMTGTIVRSQQAYYLENEIFSNNLKELGPLKEETSTYRYRIFPSSQPKQYVMVAAIPKRQGLPTYIGLVNIGTINQESTTYGIVCGSSAAKPITPAWSNIAKPKPNAGFVCPAGFKSISR